MKQCDYTSISITCLRVMILFFKENLIFLNTFLAIFCYKTNFFCLSVSINQICSTKIRLHMTYVPAYFCVVLSNNFDFFNLIPKIIFITKYCWKCVQKHQIPLRIQYHDLGTGVSTLM